MEKSELYNRAIKLRNKMFGQAHKAERAKLYPDLDLYIKEFVYGEIWHRPGLDLKTRSLCTVASLTVLGNEVELGDHIRGALNNGASKDEIIEVLIQMGIIAGFPATLCAMRIATDVFREFGFLPSTE
jgi:4-carboxymuconolactone decarboxylase